ncbi:MAG: diguanylate cyclase [bacterium]
MDKLDISENFSVDLLTRAIENAPFSCAVGDLTEPDNPLIYVNQSFLDLTGFSRDEVLGRNCRFLQCDQTDRDTVEEIRDSIQNRESIVTELVNEREDGTQFRNRLHLSPIYNEDDQATHYLSMQRDVTGVRERKQGLEDKGILFDKLQDIGNLGIWEYDVNQDELWCSWGIWEIYGVEPDNNYDLEQAMEYVLDDDRADLNEALQKAINQGKEYELQIDIERPGGEIRHARAIGKPTLSGDTVDKLQGVLVDNTETFQMQQQLETHNEFLRQLNLICSDPELEDNQKIQQILRLGCDRFDLDQGLVTRIEDDMQKVTFSAGPDEFFQPESKFPLSKSYCQFTLDNENGLSVENTSEKPYFLEDAGVLTYFGNSVQFNDETYGTVCFLSQQPYGDSFNERQKLERQIITQWIRSILKGKKTRERMEKQARTDNLTGLANRRAFFTALSEELKRHDRNDSVFSLVMLDLDHFKKINDQYGHAQGDRVLTGVANILEERCRESDKVARFGGEEFIVLLPNTKKDKATTLAGDLRRDIESLSFDQDISTTASFGVVDTEVDFDGKNDLLKKVDDALYRAKEDGRNCVKTA